MSELKSLGRYLQKNWRCVLTYPRQTSDVSLQVHVDPCWAGDLLGRESTTEVIVRRGKHLLRHMSCLQTFVALSSGEAEYYALIRARLGIQSHYQDWIVDVSIDIYSGSSAAWSVARRRGIGRTSQTLADTPLMAAEPRSSWSLEVGRCRRRATSSGHTHESTARSQDSGVVRTCWSETVAAITVMRQQQQQTREVSCG